MSKGRRNEWQYCVVRSRRVQRILCSEVGVPLRDNGSAGPIFATPHVRIVPVPMGRSILQWVNANHGGRWGFPSLVLHVSCFSSPAVRRTRTGSALWSAPQVSRHIAVSSPASCGTHSCSFWLHMFPQAITGDAKRALPECEVEYTDSPSLAGAKADRRRQILAYSGAQKLQREITARGLTLADVHQLITTLPVSKVLPLSFSRPSCTQPTGPLLWQPSQNHVSTSAAV